MPREFASPRMSCLTSMARVVVFVLLFWILFINNNSALAQMNFEPTRIVLSADERTAIISISNSSLRPQIVTPVWTDLIQAADSTLHPSGAETLPQDFIPIKVWPLKAAINPGEAIVFSLLLNPEQAIIGEKRTHLRFNVDPVYGNGPRWAAVIPVFIRDNLQQPQVEIVGVETDGDEKLFVTLKNIGQISPHGHLVVFDKFGQRLATLNNVNLFDKQKSVTFSVKITNWPKGKMKVRFIGDAEFLGTLFAEQDFNFARNQ